MNSFVLSTKRILIVPLSQKEIQFVHILHSHPQVDFYNTLGIPASTKDTEIIMQEMVSENEKDEVRKFTFIISSDTRQIGLIALNLGNSKYNNGEIWYKLLPKFWGFGYATEAVREIIKFGFETLNLHRIEAGCAAENIGSIKVLEKVGMIKEGHKRKHLPLKSGWADCYEYAVLREDYH